MEIRDVMTKNIKVVQPDTTVREAARLMKDAQIGSILVCSENRLIGIATDRDLMKRSIAFGKDPNQTLIRDVMTSPLHFCFEDQDLEIARHLMHRKQVRRLPVISRTKRLVGILSSDDLQDINPLPVSPSKVPVSAFLIAGFTAILGGGLMFLFDPKQGRRRRALMRDQGVHYKKIAQNFSHQKARHLSNRARGLIAEAKSNFYWAPEEDTWTH